LTEGREKEQRSLEKAFKVLGAEWAVEMVRANYVPAGPESRRRTSPITRMLRHVHLRHPGLSPKTPKDQRASGLQRRARRPGTGAEAELDRFEFHVRLNQECAERPGTGNARGRPARTTKSVRVQLVSVSHVSQTRHGTIACHRITRSPCERLAYTSDSYSVV
jgi:hypothetical protein